MEILILCGFCKIEKKEHHFKRYKQGNIKKCNNCNSKCIHNKAKSRCIQCNGATICIHNSNKSTCVKCKGSQICIHNKRKAYCVKCDGSQICIHKKRKSRCIECKGIETCIHKKQKNFCNICNPINWLIHNQRTRINKLISRKSRKTIKYIGCTGEFLYNYLKSLMTDDMNFDNIHIDHIKPCSRFDLTKEEEREKCFHYTNLQPLLIIDNLKKNNKWNNDDDDKWSEYINQVRSCHSDNTTMETVIAFR